MRFSRFCTYSLLGLLACAAHAQTATPVVLLQFGSYESKAEAEKKLSEITTKHAGIVGSLPTRVSEVSIAQDLSVYRTQAGPVESREKAQSICAQLASNGDECYIVETAIQASLPKPTPPAVEVAPTKEAVVKSAVEVQRDAQNMQTLAQASQQPPAPPTVEDVAAAAPQLAEPVAQDMPETAAAASDAAASANDIDAALNAAAVTAPAATAPSAPKPQMKKESSFWDSINPFSSDEEEEEEVAKPTPPPAPPADPNVTQQEAVPVEAVTTSEAQTIAPAPDAALSMPQPEAPQPEAVMDHTAPQQAPVAMAPENPDPLVNLPPLTPNPTTDSGLRLPPPPLPVGESARQQLDAQLTPQNMPSTPTGELPAPAANGTVPAPEAISAAPNFTAGSSISAAAQTADAHQAAQQAAKTTEEAPSTITAVVPGSGAVQVEEAKRVPISEDKKPAPPKPVVAQHAPTTVPLADLPSQSALNKSLWAKISYFETPQTALKFWESFRKSNPDFPVVRVRVTTNYVAAQTAEPKFSLRVGPFGSDKFIVNLCDSDAVDDADLECTMISDMGVSANPYLSPSDQPAGYKAARYGRSGKGIDALDGFWVQLGAYNSMGKAKEGWEELRKEYDEVLSSAQAQVSTPPMGSQANPVYRLRAGPFVNQGAAEEVCVRLLEEKASCLVVAEK